VEQPGSTRKKEEAVTPDRWQQVDHLMEKALELEPDQRTSFLDQACKDDEPLRNELETLLTAHDKAESFLEKPPRDLALGLLRNNSHSSWEQHAVTAGTKLVERYQVVEKIGAGGMGEVYRARDLRLGREVAIKVLPDHLANDSRALDRFEREAKALAALSHNNILTIFDFGSDRGISFAVMELLKGQTLRALISQSQLTWKKAVKIGISTADALAAAHSAKVIHRDLKPENIFITSDGLVRILDFGLAKWVEEAIAPERTDLPTASANASTIAGTVPYMSPEQLRSEPLDGRTDIFSFGCVLYELVSRTKPFQGKSNVDIISAILKEEPPELDSSLPVPAALQEVICRCLKKKPEQRFQTARDLLFALQMIQNESTASRSDPIITSHSPSRLKLLVAILAALATLAIGSLLYQRFTPSSNAVRSLAILPFENAGNDPATEYLSDGIMDGIINSLSQLPQLRVMARGTAFRYKDKDVDPRAAGRELKVEAVVTGRMSQRGEALTISVGLVRVQDGTQLWGHVYNRKVPDIVRLQAEMSSQIAEKLQLKLTGKEKAQIARQYTEDADAYRLYLKGMHHWWKGTREEYEEARKYFEESLEEDPLFALAHVGLGMYFIAMAFDGYLPPNEGMPRGVAALRRALELDNGLGVAHHLIGEYEFVYEWNWQDAEKEHQRGINLDPGNSIGHRGYSWYLTAMGRLDEALDEIRKAQELDPLQRAYSVQTGQTLGLAGQYEKAVAELKKTIRMYPDYDAAHFSLADVYVRMGEFDRAIEENRKAFELLGDQEGADIFNVTGGSEAYWKAMKSIAKRSLGALQEEMKSGYVPPIRLAEAYAQLGDRDAAFDWLEEAYREKSYDLVMLNAVDTWDPIRSDPRFANLVQRIGLPTIHHN
jgi:serine/threonine protein kinase/tetratricopeptide (TPR) repeat protein